MIDQNDLEGHGGTTIGYQQRNRINETIYFIRSESGLYCNFAMAGRNYNGSESGFIVVAPLVRIDRRTEDTTVDDNVCALDVRTKATG